jgi:hypothetical protein
MRVKKKQQSADAKLSLPRGSGFLLMKKMLGRPPLLDVQGTHADIDSSATSIDECCTCIKRESILNKAMVVFERGAAKSVRI